MFVSPSWATKNKFCLIFFFRLSTGDWCCWSYVRPFGEIKDTPFSPPSDVGRAALFPFATAVEIIASSYLSLWLNSAALRPLGVDSPLYIAEVIPIVHPAEDCIKRQITRQHFNMYSNKNEGPRRGRSFDSMNIGFEEKLLNNEVRTF